MKENIRKGKEGPSFSAPHKLDSQIIANTPSMQFFYFFDKLWEYLLSLNSPDKGHICKIYLLGKFGLLLILVACSGTLSITYAFPDD